MLAKQKLEFLEFDSNIYNRLSDVMTAESALNRTDGYAKIFSDIAHDVVEKRCEDLFGLTLLHRHNYVPPGSRMEEDCAWDGSCTLLRMQLEDSPSQDAVPISWQVDLVSNGYSLLPLEFSRRPLAVSLFQQALSNIEMLHALAERIYRSGLSRIVGISLLRQSEIAVPGETLVETEDQDCVANVLRPVSPNEVDEDTMIITNWKFARGAGAVPTAGCNPDVFCVKDYDGRHRREPRHWPMG